MAKGRVRGIKGDSIFVMGGVLTEEGRKLLASCMVEVFFEKGEWDFGRCAKLMRERGVEVSERYVRQEWAGPGRVAIESLMRGLREEYLSHLEGRLRYEILKAGVDVAKVREGDWSEDLKNLAVAAKKLSGGERLERATPQVPAITFQKVEVFPGGANVASDRDGVIEAEKVECGIGSGSEPGKS